MSLQFDPNAYLDLPIEVPLEKRPPIPIGDYYATVKDLTARQWQSKDKYDDAGQLKSGLAYDVQLELQIPEATRTMIGLAAETITLKDGIMVDLTKDGAIDTAKGKNGQLRRYREALDMNKPGESFRPRAMVGRMLMVRVIHEIYQDQPQERVGGVAKIG